MRQREFLGVLGGAAACLPFAARAQQPATLRVGGTLTAPRTQHFLQGFEVRMRELGYVEGQNLTLDYIDMQGQPDR
jgi:putative ABC transport system substrate-binding protein